MCGTYSSYFGPYTYVNAFKQYLQIINLTEAEKRSVHSTQHSSHAIMMTIGDESTMGRQVQEVLVPVQDQQSQSRTRSLAGSAYPSLVPSLPRAMRLCLPPTSVAQI